MGNRSIVYNIRLKQAVIAAGEDGCMPSGVLLSTYCGLAASADAVNSFDEDEDEDVPEVVLGMSSGSMLRAACIKITRHRAFDIYMTLCILISCVSMTIERPSLQEGSSTLVALNRIDLVLTLVFAVECGLKIITYNPLNYWRKHSNKIDACIVFISFLLMAVEDSGLSAIESLRVLRALKAIRIATRSEAMKHQVALVISSLASMVCTSVVYAWLPILRCFSMPNNRTKQQMFKYCTCLHYFANNALMALNIFAGQRCSASTSCGRHLCCPRSPALFWAVLQMQR